MGTKYVIKSVKDVVHIDREGSNQTIYRIPRGENGLLIQYARSVTMDGMVTNVVVTGKTDENGKTKVETRVPRNKKTYGTLTRVIHKDEDTKLSEIKKRPNTYWMRTLFLIRNTISLLWTFPGSEKAIKF